MKKKIVHVIGGLGIGGAETAIVNSLKYVNWEEFEFIFVCFGEERTYEYTEIIESYENSSIYFIDTPSYRNAYKHIKQIKELLYELKKVSVIHVYTLLHSALVIRAVNNSIPIVVHAHSSADNSLKSNFSRKIYEYYSKSIIQRSSAYFIACGDEAGKYLFGKKRFEVIYNGVDTDFVSKLETSIDVVQKNDIRIGIFGRLTDVKNHRFALETLTKLVRINDNVRLTIVGEGELRSELEEYARELKIENYVEFLGLRRDVLSLMCRTDLLWMPSKFEGFPMVLIESQAVGLPSVISDNIDEIVDLNMGLVNFCPLVISNWVEKTNKLIMNLNGTQRVYNNTQILYEKGFSSKNYADRMENIYNQITGE